MVPNINIFEVLNLKKQQQNSCYKSWTISGRSLYHHTSLACFWSSRIWEFIPKLFSLYFWQALSKNINVVYSVLKSFSESKALCDDCLFRWYQNVPYSWMLKYDSSKFKQPISLWMAKVCNPSTQEVWGEETEIQSHSLYTSSRPALVIWNHVSKTKPN